MFYRAEIADSGKGMREDLSADLGHELDPIEDCRDSDSLAIGFFDSYHRGLAESPATWSSAQARWHGNYYLQPGSNFESRLRIEKNTGSTKVATNAGLLTTVHVAKPDRQLYGAAGSRSSLWRRIRHVSSGSSVPYF